MRAASEKQDGACFFIDDSELTATPVGALLSMPFVFSASCARYLVGEELSRITSLVEQGTLITLGFDRLKLPPIGLEMPNC